MAENCGLQLVEKRGLGYNPFTQNFRLMGFTGMAYLLAMKKV
jgi:2-polyprenyl-6-hydroxyphenyl methylase/3-demethylubiquinone-9 3-methyltransferase